VNTGETRQLDVIDAVLASWSPHGYRIAYTRRLSGQPGQPVQGDVWTIPAAGGEPTAVTTGVATDWNPAWSPDGRYLYYASDRGGSMNLWRAPIDEESGRALGDPEPITTPATSLGHISLGLTPQVAYSLLGPITSRQRFDPALCWGVERSTAARWSSPDPSPTANVAPTTVQPEGDLTQGADGMGLRQVTAIPPSTACPKVPTATDCAFERKDRFSRVSAGWQRAHPIDRSGRGRTCSRLVAGRLTDDRRQGLTADKPGALLIPTVRGAAS
jgi:hypothetical protein